MRSFAAIIFCLTPAVRATAAEPDDAPVKLHATARETAALADGSVLVLLHPGTGDFPLWVQMTPSGSGSNFLAAAALRFNFALSSKPDEAVKSLAHTEITGGATVRLSARLVALSFRDRPIAGRASLPNPLYFRPTAKGWERVDEPTAAEKKELKPLGEDDVYASRAFRQNRLPLFADSARTPDGVMTREVALVREKDDWSIAVRVELLLPDKRVIARAGVARLEELSDATRTALAAAHKGATPVRVAATPRSVIVAPPEAKGVIAFSPAELFAALANAAAGVAGDLDRLGRDLDHLARGTGDATARTKKAADDRYRDSLALAAALLTRMTDEHREPVKEIAELRKDVIERQAAFGDHTIKVPLVWADAPWVGYYQKAANRLHVMPGSIEWAEDSTAPATHVARLDKQSWLVLDLKPKFPLRIVTADHDGFRRVLARTEALGGVKDVRLATDFPDSPRLEVVAPRSVERPTVRLCRFQGDRLRVVLAVERGQRTEELIGRLTGDGLNVRLVWTGAQFGFTEPAKEVVVPCELRLGGRPKVVTPPPEKLAIQIAATPGVWAATIEKELGVVVRYRDQKAVTVTLKRNAPGFESVEFPMELSDDKQPIYRYRYFSPTKQEWVETDDSVLIIE